MGSMVCAPAEQDPEVLMPGGTHHHMGTTRMHVDATQGVVDSSSRVHGVDNLFVAGSSVFPTGGYANPTLTIVALAVRLADHVRSLMHA
jgi:choline dehydrogenase-like flavoprotein